MIPKYNRKFLTKFHNDGGTLVMVSSRSEAMKNKVERKLGFEVDFIGGDGTFIIANGKKIKSTYFEPIKIKNLIDELRRDFDPYLFLLSSDDIPIILTRTNTSKTTNFFYFMYMFFQGAYRERWVRSDHVFYSELEKGKSYKLMMMVGVGKNKKALAEKLTKEFNLKYKDFEFVYCGEFIEITPKGCSKANAIAFYLEYAGISKDNIMVVGDSGNDVPMFDAYKAQSYCMSHAPESVKSHANAVIDKVGDLGKILYPSEDSKSLKRKEEKR